MDVLNEKIVDYDPWCDQCKYKDTLGTEEPCNECLSTPARMGSRKPVKFEEKDN